MFDLGALVRENIRRLTPYSSARNEFSGTADIYLDANENAFGSPIGGELNRYPDPLQSALKSRVADLAGVRTSQIFVGNGSDEAIDLAIRIFCTPGRDRIMICPPTYGMYSVAANINDAPIDSVPLTRYFQLDVPAILRALTPETKIIFLCTPNNPTGNSLRRDDVIAVIEAFDGIVVVDEAYIHFSTQSSFGSLVDTYPNLVVLQTFSKAWGIAGARVGTAFADEAVIELFNRVKPPYNVGTLAQEAAIAALDQRALIADWIDQTREQRDVLSAAFAKLDFVVRVFPSDANFLLVKMRDAVAVYRSLIDSGIVVRDRSGVILCDGCLRITVGTPDENRKLLEVLGGLNF